MWGHGGFLWTASIPKPPSPRGARIGVRPAHSVVILLTHPLGTTALIDALEERTGLTRSQACEVVDAFLDALIESVRSGARVTLPRLGTFRLRPMAPRVTFVPGTREAIRLPASPHLSFKATPSLNRALWDDETDLTLLERGHR